MDTFIETYTVQKISMLREFCKKTGVQILLREYDFSTKKHATFSDDDIVNIFPVVKSITPKATDATSYFEAAQSRLQSGKQHKFRDYHPKFRTRVTSNNNHSKFNRSFKICIISIVAPIRIRFYRDLS